MTKFERDLERLVMMLSLKYAPHTLLDGSFKFGAGYEERLREKIRGVVQVVVAAEEQVTEERARQIMREQPQRVDKPSVNTDPEAIELAFRLPSYESLEEESDPKAGVDVKLTITNGSISLGTLETYGTLGMQPGAGEPLFIEHFEGDLRVVIWADINKEDPTHTISFKDARETNRKGQG